MKKHEKYMNLLFKLATDTIPVGCARVSACVVIKNQIISFGVNRRKTHPLQAKFSSNDESIYLHAEIDAIINALRIVDVDDLKNSTLYVSRAKYSSSNRTKFIGGLSKPCKGCSSALQWFEIKKVVYLNDDGDFVEL